MSFHDDCLVFDGHTDVPNRLWESPADLRERLADRHIDLPRLREGGVDALVFALYVPASLSPREGWDHARELYRLSIEQLRDGLERADSAEAVRRVAARGAVAVVFGLENGRPLSVPGALEECARMGVRYVTLTHVGTHEWCDASTDDAVHGGLAPQGVRLVRAMNGLGILPDVSHVSDAAVAQVLDVSAVPPVASHSSARALCDHPRNLPDDLIREIARRGGVVMANTYPAFIGPAASLANKKRLEEIGPTLAAMEEAYLRQPQILHQDIQRLMAAHPLPPVPLSAYVDHLLHLVEIAGEEHVGIGTDFDGIPETLEGFEDVARFPDLTAALLDRGIDRSGVRLILGENFLRLLTAAEKAVG
ncbi:MAG TPA: dipeptidase [Thermoanaerobaculia bacterium]|nr:dipeptidase [Thermoanaerobaculia bacterium]